MLVIILNCPLLIYYYFYLLLSLLSIFVEQCSAVQSWHFMADLGVTDNSTCGHIRLQRLLSCNECNLKPWSWTRKSWIQVCFSFTKLLVTVRLLYAGSRSTIQDPIVIYITPASSKALTWHLEIYALLLSDVTFKSFNSNQIKQHRQNTTVSFTEQYRQPGRQQHSAAAICWPALASTTRWQ